MINYRFRHFERDLFFLLPAKKVSIPYLNSIAPNPSYQAIWNRCTIRGVVDNNIFDSVKFPIRSDTGTGTSSWWDHFSVIQYGAADDNLYFEDNIFNGSSVNMEGIKDSQFSGRYIFRYNTMIATTVGSYPVFDMHGNQESDMCACFGGEIYGNHITKGAYGATLLDHRGGKALVFNNYLQAQGAAIQVREEFDDANSPTTGGTQHVNDAYYWGNWVLRVGGLERITAYIATRDYWHNGLEEDVDFFQGKDSFDGTSGVGCGTLAAMPATCTVGVGYWATEQSCTDLTGMVGANPATPISGTLYKCIATNTWTAYYTPLEYPHPLRGESLVLRATPADQAIHLTWQVGASLPPTSTWQIVYDGPTGDQPSPISGIINPTRAYTLTGLTNYTWYTVTLNAMSGSTPFLTDTVRVMPSDIFVYLPLVLSDN